MTSIRLLFLALIFHQLFIINCSASITINSVSVTVSTCLNNGTATIFASSTSDSAVFLYNIVAGPVLYPLQNDSTFKSLYPGTYTARVHDVNSYDSATTTFTITGTYKQLAVTATPVAPLCGGGNNSKIIANPNGTGLAPYTWQIISPYTGTPQASDTLDSLAAGTYIVKITDACDIAVTQGAVVDSGGSGFAQYDYNVGFIGCDTAQLVEQFYLNKSFANIPLKFTFITSSDTVVNFEIPIASSDTFSNLYTITDTLYHVKFGNLLRICITDVCNITYCLPADTVNPFEFGLMFTDLGNNCVTGTSGSAVFNSLASQHYIEAYPDAIVLTITLTDTATKMVIDSVVASYISFSTITALTGGPYLLTVKDDCGDTFQQMIQWPHSLSPSFNAKGWPIGSCIDSTGIGQLTWYGFGSNLTIKLLSGPTFGQSTKQGFEYYGAINYPIVFTDVPNKGYYNVDEMPAGTYTYQASDSCGNTFNGSFSITTVSSYALDYTLKRSCGGLNSVYVFLGNGGTISFADIYLFHNNNSLAHVTNDGGSRDTMTSLTQGKYIMQVYFQSGFGDATMPGLPFCWFIADTITIPPINDSILAATDVATCNGNIYIHIDADTFNGVLPFKYEIIHGPETFAPQYSNLFTVSHYGTYTVGVVDSCVNVDARQITVDTGRFSPVVRSGGWCPGSKAKLIEVASPFFSYRWLKPDGAVYFGDTLVIDPFTEADTGVYQITKTVNINGCTDSAFGSYHLVFRDTFQQSISICPGDTLHVGPYIHTTGGLYADTLSGVDGCDSIEVSSISLLPSTQVSITPAEPPVCHTGPVMLVAAGGTTYVWTPGNYQTDTIGVNPHVKTVYKVVVSDTSACSSTASVTVYPSTDSAITITKTKTIFCADDSAELCAPAGYTTYQWSSGLTGTGDCVYAKQAGDYYVMANDSNGCVVPSNHLSVSVYPVPSVSIIVLGDTLTSFGQVSYQWLFNDNPIPGATGQVYIAHLRGNYSVEVTDTNGCTTISNPVFVTAVQNLAEEENVTLYPNPSFDNWQLTVDNSLLGSALEVFDEQGRLVFQSKISLLKSKIELDVATGVYYLRISNERVSVVRKLVKM